MFGAAEAMSIAVCVECSRLLLWGREVRLGSPVKKGKTQVYLREVTNVSSVAYLLFYNLLYIHLPPHCFGLDAIAHLTDSPCKKMSVSVTECFWSF